MNYKTSNRIWFAQSLRGLAALIVVYSHLFEGFWKKQDIAAAISHTQKIEVNYHLPHFYISDFLSTFHFNFGSFGVAVFFLISGFVIPISLDKMRSDKFLINRFFRIYPTYVVGLVITCFFIFLYTLSHGTTFPYKLSDILYNASLFRDWFWIPSIDYVNWTLEIEMKFYLLCAFLALISNLHSSRTILITTSLMTILSVSMNGKFEYLFHTNFTAYKLAYILSTNSMFLIFMFIGTCFYNYHVNNWPLKIFIRNTIIIWVFFVIAVFCNPNNAQIIYLLSSHFIAITLFVLVFIFRNNLPYNRYLNFISEISFPLYITHGICGYILINVFYIMFPSPYLNILMALFVIIIISYLVHVMIEKPSILFGKKILARINHNKSCNDNLANESN